MKKKAWRVAFKAMRIRFHELQEDASVEVVAFHDRINELEKEITRLTEQSLHRFRMCNEREGAIATLEEERDDLRKLATDYAKEICELRESLASGDKRKVEPKTKP